MFSTLDLTSVTATNESDPLQIVSAEINQNLLQHRLVKTIPWFLTTIGAWQDTFNYGICISYQYWNFQTRNRLTDTGALDGETGGPSYKRDIEIIKDEPAIDLIPVENFRFSQAADWRDVVGTSPFLERLIPLTLEEVRERMDMEDPKTGKPKWRKYSDQQILSASTSQTEEEALRQQRMGKNRADPHERTGLPDDYQTIWCREYIMRDGGIDWVFYTIGHGLMLTDPVEIDEVYFHGKRPFTVGFSVVEAHKCIPTSRNELIAPIQVTMNRMTNQRLDNVDLVLNKRYFMRRGQNIDTRALMRNTPGGGVYMDDPENDVKVVSTQDVTSSSYEEHNRLSNEVDELAGNFSPSSVQSNRQLNETVGGMQMLSLSSDDITEYAITTFINTWVEPTLRQIMQLEQAYETDQVVLGIAANKSKHYQRTNLQGDIPEQLLTQNLNLSVDAGAAATDPTQKADKLVRSLGHLLQLMPELRVRLNPDPIIKKVLAGAGERNGEQFFKPVEEVEHYMQIAMAQAMEQIKAQRGKTPEELAFEQWKLQQTLMLEMMKEENQQEYNYSKLASERELTLERLYADLGIKEGDRASKERMARWRETNIAQELLFKAMTGRQGI